MKHVSKDTTYLSGVMYPIFVFVEPLHEREDIARKPRAEAKRKEAVAEVMILRILKAVVYNSPDAGADQPKGM